MLRALFATILFAATAVQAMEPIDVKKTRFAKAELTVTADGEDQSFTPAELEQLGTYAMTTYTPWRESPAEFVGVRLTDLLSATGLEDVSAIRVVAENDYAITMERDVWTNHDLLIATRVDGRGHTRRARGPIQFVFNMSQDPVTGDEDFQSNWVWMAARIEPVE
ncbi:MAG: hypothetical protein AAF557_11530 [Pseudomonadota bacterium]